MSVAQVARVASVAFIALPLTTLRLIATSKTVRLCAFVLLGARLATRGYREGEGPLSPKMPVTIAPGNGIGGFLFENCQEFRGRTYLLTRSESESLALLIEAVQVNDEARPALNDFLEHFPRK